jgi:polyisoprenoid-binding protein YceI
MARLAVRSSLVALQMLGLGQGTAHGGPRQYTLDPKASEIVVHVGTAGLLRFAGHEQDVVAGSFRGTVNVDPEQIERSSVDVTVDAASLRVTARGDSAKEVQAKMLGPKCLDVARYPSIRFVSKKVTAEHGPGGVLDISIQGALTLHGVTREITLRVRLELEPDSMRATGATTLLQKEFGITPISIAGMVKVKNELALRWRFVGRRALNPGP